MKAKRGRRSRRGTAAVELAVLLPFLCLASLGAMSFGLALRAAAAVCECARSGAMAAIDTDVGDASLDGAIRNAAAAANAADPNASIAPILDTPPTITIEYGSAGGFAYVDVTASYTYHGFVGVSWWGLGSQTIVRKVRMMRHTPAGS